MPLDESQWERAEPDDDIVTVILNFLENERPVAYSIDEIFDRAESRAEAESDSAWAEIGALLGGESAERKYRWAFEYLVHEGKLEKRVVIDGAEEVEYYRAA